MLYYDIIDVSDQIDVNKTSASIECDVFHYWYFLNYIFKFQRNVCNRCHDLLTMSVSLIDIAILSIKGSDYHCIIIYIYFFSPLMYNHTTFSQLYYKYL